MQRQTYCLGGERGISQRKSGSWWREEPTEKTHQSALEGKRKHMPLRKLARNNWSGELLQHLGKRSDKGGFYAEQHTARIETNNNV